MIELEPGAEVPEHSHDNEQLGVLIAGSLSFTIGGEHGEVRPGSFWRILANVPHSVVAGPEGAVAVEVFAPPRNEWAGTPAGRARPRPVAVAALSSAPRLASTRSSSTRVPSGSIVSG